MTVQQAAQKAVDAIEKIAQEADLKGTSWYEFLEEVTSRIESFEECYREEHPEEFK